MQNEAIRLSIFFFEEVKKFGKDMTGRIQAPDHYKNHIFHQVQQLLAGGTSPSLLSSLLQEYAQKHPSPQEVYDIEEILHYFQVDVRKGEVTQDPDNLMQPGVFYYHPALQVAPPPPTIIQLPDGSFQSSYEQEEFYLEMKDRFTLDDLVDYFYRKMEITHEFRERDKGAFRHLLKSFDLDTILYTIDEARLVAEDLGKLLPKSPFDLRDYLEYGIAILEDRKNTCYMEGLDHVIPKS